MWHALAKMPMTTAGPAELSIRTSRLVISAARSIDATEALALLRHPDLEFTNRAVIDAVEARDLGRKYDDQAGQAGEISNDIHHNWMVRTADGTLVAVAHGRFMSRPTDHGTGEERIFEPTIHVHPAHQDNRSGSEAIDAIETFAQEHYGATESRFRIDPTNHKSIDRAKRRGAKRLMPVLPGFDSLETWGRALSGSGTD
jgi:hypothetical protein